MATQLCSIVTCGFNSETTVVIPLSTSKRSHFLVSLAQFAFCTSYPPTK